MEAYRIARAAAQRQRKISAIAEVCRKTLELLGAVIIRLVRDEDGNEPRAVFGNIAPGECAAAFACPAFADREEAAKPPVSRAVHGINKERRAIRQIEAAANDEPHACDFGRLMRAHESRKRAAVCDRERLDP